MARKALGRGLRALIPETAKPTQTPDKENQKTDNETAPKLVSNEALSHVDIPAETTTAREYLRYIDINLIVPNAQQPRTEWISEALEELTKSVISRGLLEPIILRPKGEKYEIVAGERRWRACKIAGYKEIPAIVRTLADIESLEVALVENVQRSNLNPVDEARAYKVLAQEYSLTHEEIALRMGKDRSTITNLLRLLKLSDEILKHVSRETLSMGHARVLLGLLDEQREELASRIIKDKWSVREAESWVRNLNKNKANARKTASVTVTKPESIRRLEEELCRHFSAEVKIKLSKRGGRLEIQYHDDEELSRILDQLRIVIA